MARILFPTTNVPGKEAVEGNGKLVNAYAEPLGEGAPAGHVLRRVPGLTTFAETEESAFRGCWYDGDSYIYAAFSDTLIRIDSAGTETTVGSILDTTVLFCASQASTTNSTTYTFSSLAVGAPHPDRRIVVGVFFDAADDYPATVTIGGVAATLVLGQSSLVAQYVAHVPLGSSISVVVTYATAASRCAIGVWRLDGVLTNAPADSDSSTGSDSTGVSALSVPYGGKTIGVAKTTNTNGIDSWTGSVLFTEDFDIVVESAATFSGASGGENDSAFNYSVIDSGATLYAVWTSWAASGTTSTVTFAKNNADVPDKVLCAEGLGAFSFTASAVTKISVNSETPNSVCFGEGYFFFTVPRGVVYASNINSTTVTSTDVVRMEARPEELVRGVFYNGELFVFGKTHCEVWASNGNPNATGFPFNRTTTIWKGLIGTLAICGMEEGFEGTLIWVADDNSVRQLQGYQAAQISPPDLERDIEDCTSKSSIRCWVYDLDGHACVGVHIPGVSTWVYDLSTGWWHQRNSLGEVDCRIAGNSVKAFGKWIAGDTDSGNLFQIDDTALDEAGDALPFIVDSIAMESFPTRLQVPGADFNFKAGVGTPTVDDPKCMISWSDDGGETWSDPVTRKLGEAGRPRTQVRVNRAGLTGVKGRRWRVRVDDEVYVGLLGGDMTVQGRPS